MRELTIKEALDISAMPLHLEESSSTAFLRSATVSVKPSTSPFATSPDNNNDPLRDPCNWTVQERMMAICHYRASLSDDEGPDFRVGENGRYTDYLDATMEGLAEPVVLGEVGGDVWSIGHLTGAMAESIERLLGEIKNISNRLHWIVGGMACQMIRKDESLIDASSNDFDHFLLSRINIMLGFPEREFERLMFLYLDGREKLHHLFITEFSEEGIVALPVTKEDKEKGGDAKPPALPPARFPVRSQLSQFAVDLAKKPD
jgi:hypothetical protein